MKMVLELLSHIKFLFIRREGVHACVLSHFSPVRLFVTLWTAACQALLSMGFSRQEHWSELPCPPPEEKAISMKGNDAFERMLT